ncbi:MAG: hypothetical protein AAF414_06300 [Pseudomonadota bacterium]
MEMFSLAGFFAELNDKFEDLFCFVREAVDDLTNDEPRLELEAVEAVDEGGDVGWGGDDSWDHFGFDFPNCDEPDDVWV